MLHVTTSFDLGGTQKQIQHLATCRSARYRHDVVEIFPELNYMFRQGHTVDPSRYVRGGPLARAAGRVIVNRSKRGSHLVQVWKLVRDFRQERPQVVVGWGHEICVTTFVAATIARVPRIVFCIRTVNPTYGWTEPWFASLLHDAHSRMTPRVDRVVVNSTFLQTDHGAWLSVDPGSIPVCHNGIDVNIPPADDVRAARCQMRQALRIPDDTVVITNIGRFSREKGQLSLVDANRRLLDRTTARVVWLLCGDGPTLPDVQAAVASAEMTNVVFTGRTDVPWRILAASDIFVMPSDFEGMPNAMMEAMVAGVPCVSTNRSGICDVARDGVEALYYEPGDTVRLAQLLQSLAEDPARARAMGAAAAARVRDFSVTRLVECFERVLDGVAGAA